MLERDGKVGFSREIIVENISFIYTSRDIFFYKNLLLNIADKEIIVIARKNSMDKSIFVCLLTENLLPNKEKSISR